MIEIDPRNGKILQQVDINKVNDEYCLGVQNKYGGRTIFLGRNGNKLHGSFFLAKTKALQ
jgi:hypothetical protein